MKEPMTSNSSDRTTPIDSRHGDIECFLGFASGRYTRTHGPFWFGIALVLTVLSWIALIPFRETYFGKIITSGFYILIQMRIMFLGGRLMADGKHLLVGRVT